MFTTFTTDKQKDRETKPLSDGDPNSAQNAVCGSENHVSGVPKGESPEEGYFNLMGPDIDLF